MEDLPLGDGRWVYGVKQGVVSVLEIGLTVKLVMKLAMKLAPRILHYRPSEYLTL